MFKQQNNKERRRPRRKRDSQQKEREYDRKVISIRRVAKVRAGAKRLRFSAMVAVGDRKGKVAVCLARGSDARSAVQKAEKTAAARQVKVDLVGDTIPHEVFMKYGAAKLMIKPAGPGTGVIASDAVRSIMELSGVRNVLTKQLGTNNPLTNAYCAFRALKSLDKSRILARRTKKLKSKLDKKKGGTSQSTTKEK